MKKRRILYSPILKVISTILISFLFLGLAVSGGVVGYFSVCNNAYDGTVESFIRDDPASNYVHNDLLELCHMIATERPEDEIVKEFGEKETNLRVIVMDGNKVLFNNTSGNNKPSEYTYWYGDGSYSYWGDTTDDEGHTEVILNEVDSNALHKFTIDYELDSEMKVQDKYRSAYVLISRLFSMKGQLYFAFWVFLILTILDLTYMFCAAGHRMDTDGISLNRIDFVPSDFLFVFCSISAIMWLLIIMPFVEIGFVTMTYHFDILVILMAIIFFPAGYLVLLWLMSFVRQVKYGRWYDRVLIFNLVKSLFAWIGRICEAMPVIWKGILYLFVFSVFCMLSIKSFFNFLVAFLMGIYGIYVIWEYAGISKMIRSFSKGDLDVVPDIKNMHGFMRKNAEELSDIRNTISSAVEKRVKSERLKSELITNVSHDIRTPLTSIVNYVDLMKKEHTEEQEKEYIEILDRNAQRLKKLTDDLIEASKASSGNVTVNLQPLCVKEIIDQALAEYDEKFKKAKLMTVVHYEDEHAMAMADGRLLWRALSNLLGNCSKYAMPSTRVYIDVAGSHDQVEITIKNISAETLNIPADELMERFVREDSSRHTKGSGLGLDIAKSLIGLQTGEFRIEIDGDLFKAVIALRRV